MNRQTHWLISNKSAYVNSLYWAHFDVLFVEMGHERLDKCQGWIILVASKQRIDVFVSSTSEDLKEYRQAVRDVVISFKFTPEMMEFFSAMGDDAVEVCLAKVAASDIYIGIFAHRYGYCPNGYDISITEMEFNSAIEKGIPCLCFLLDENINWPPKYIEGEPGKTKLANLKAKINSRFVRRTFTSPENLALEVAKALHPYSNRERLDFKIGPYRAFDVGEFRSPTSEQKQTKRASVQLFIDGDVSNFDKATLVNALSGILGISQTEINISQVISGSIVVEIELPEPAAKKLVALATAPNVLNKAAELPTSSPSMLQRRMRYSRKLLRSARTSVGARLTLLFYILVCGYVLLWIPPLIVYLSQGSDWFIYRNFLVIWQSTQGLVSYLLVSQYIMRRYRHWRTARDIGFLALTLVLVCMLPIIFSPSETGLFFSPYSMTLLYAPVLVAFLWSIMSIAPIWIFELVPGEIYFQSSAFSTEEQGKWVTPVISPRTAESIEKLVNYGIPESLLSIAVRFGSPLYVKNDLVIALRSHFENRKRSIATEKAIQSLPDGTVEQIAELANSIYTGLASTADNYEEEASKALEDFLATRGLSVLRIRPIDSIRRVWQLSDIIFIKQSINAFSVEGASFNLTIEFGMQWDPTRAHPLYLRESDTDQNLERVRQTIGFHLTKLAESYFSHVPLAEIPAVIVTEFIDILSSTATKQSSPHVDQLNLIRKYLGVTILTSTISCHFALDSAEQLKLVLMSPMGLWNLRVGRVDAGERRRNVLNIYPEVGYVAFLRAVRHLRGESPRMSSTAAQLPATPSAMVSPPPPVAYPPAAAFPDANQRDRDWESEKVNRLNRRRRKSFRDFLDPDSIQSSREEPDDQQ